MTQHPSDERAIMESGILLEAGTNELEALIFLLDGHPYGINVAKIREVMISPQIRKLPKAPEAVEGVFYLRDTYVPLIQLRKHLKLTPYPEGALEDGSTRVIVAEFNNQLHAFRVDSVERICRLALQDINSMPKLPEFSSVQVVALAVLGDRLVPMLDFELIVAELKGGQILKVPLPRKPESADRTERRKQKRVVVAEDSLTIRKLMVHSLKQAGYQDLSVFDDGQQAWNFLAIEADNGRSVDLIITDIEMPQLDGLRLCRLVRENPVHKTVPVVLFSSLVTPDNLKKGEQVGATAQISKPELAQLVDLMDQILEGKGL